MNQTFEVIETEIIFPNGASSVNEPIRFFDPGFDLWLTPDEIDEIERQAQRNEYEDLYNLGVK